MEFLELAKSRYSVRKYDTRKVEEEKLSKILEAGRVAPTAANFQPHSLIVVETQEGLDKLKKCANAYGAPLAIIVCGDHNVSWKRSFDGKDVLDIDVSIVTDHMMLQAAELGLGTVWICHFNPEILRAEFGLPEHIEAVNILAIGYPAGEKASPDRHNTARKSLQEIVHYEKY
ncbi:nitroreductase [Anaerosolibacter carboniphilus]|uniref:Nitroreductase n=1 Tax=Anaerosolibacter carboniphilus TaxID=1417629 RepID=A0A841KMI5_9FIRM|nr:nitroreductase family protein [Anaerosolibacter carboniphilus]MBB6214471.1 nitroreductase [Anaerosolibacter carboniphilus]